MVPSECISLSSSFTGFTGLAAALTTLAFFDPEGVVADFGRLEDIAVDFTFVDLLRASDAVVVLLRWGTGGGSPECSVRVAPPGESRACYEKQNKKNVGSQKSVKSNFDRKSKGKIEQSDCAPKMFHPDAGYKPYRKFHPGAGPWHVPRGRLDEPPPRRGD